MTTWKNPIRHILVVPLLALATPCVAANAVPPSLEPVVLNGQLNTRDFTGGVGNEASDGGYYNAASVYGSSPNNEFNRTLAFIAAVRNRALHGASMNGRSFGHR